MCSRLSKFLHKFDCLYKKQFEFRNANSTTHALISLTDNIQQTIVNDTLSNNKIEVIHAVPQGSVFGSLLFLIY